MQRFKNILYVNDPENNRSALERAIRLARLNEADLSIVSVSEDFSFPGMALLKTFKNIKEDQLQDLLEKIPSEDINITSRHLTGIPFIEIIKQVQAKDIDLVIKPVEGKGGLSDMLFGSEDMHLLRKCPCPVWLVKPAKRKTYTSILAAVDPDPSEEENAELNQLILDLASSLAIRENAELHILHAWEMPYEATLRSGRSPLPKSEIDKMVSDVRTQHRGWLDQLIAGYDFEELPFKTHLIKGAAGDILADQAHKKSADLLVMGTVARTGIPGFFIGNTAEKTLSKVDCSVLTVKPGAFLTPVD